MKPNMYKFPALFVIMYILIYPLQGQKIQKFLSRGNIEKAITSCEKLDPDEKIKGYSLIADYFFNQKEFSKAEEFYLKSNSPEKGMVKIAEHYLTGGDITNAEVFFKKTPEPEIGLLKIADYSLEKGEVSLAEQYYEKADMEKSGCTRIGDMFLLQENFKEAKDYYDKAGRDIPLDSLISLKKALSEAKITHGMTIGNKGLQSFNEMEKITLFNPAVENDAILLMSFNSHTDNIPKFMVVISFISKENNFTSSFYYPRDYLDQSGYYISGNSITLRLRDDATESPGFKINLSEKVNNRFKIISNSLTVAKEIK